MCCPVSRIFVPWREQIRQGCLRSAFRGRQREVSLTSTRQSSLYTCLGFGRSYLPNTSLPLAYQARVGLSSLLRSLSQSRTNQANICGKYLAAFTSTRECAIGSKPLLRCNQQRRCSSLKRTPAFPLDWATATLDARCSRQRNVAWPSSLPCAPSSRSMRI